MASFHFQPLFLPDCEAPREALQKVAKERGIDPSALEIKLHEVFYFIKSEKNPAFEELKESERAILDDEAFLLRPEVEIRQHFALTLEPKATRPYTLSLRLSKDARELFLKLHQGSKVAYNAAFAEELFEQIRAHKALLGVFFRQESKERERLIAFLKERRHEKILERDYEILLALGVGGKPCVEPTLMLHFQEEGAHEARFLPVQAGTKLATFLKPQSGSTGRDCLGRFIPAQEPQSRTQSPLKIDSTLSAIDEKDRIDYIAQRSGFLSFEAMKLSIQSRIELQSVDTKTTGSILGGLELETSVVVRGDHCLEEALGDASRIEASEVEIAGNIGRSSSILAHRVSVAGQTHQSSKIIAKEAKIEIHKGYLEASEARITRLEAGIVKAQKVYVQSAQGGKIYAKEIYIESLRSNLHAFASEKIEIERLLGEDNKFTLTPTANPLHEERIATILAELERLALELRQKIKAFNQEAKEIKNLRPMAEKVKAMIATNPTQTPPYLREQLQNYIALLKQTQAQKEEIETLQRERDSLARELEELSAPTLEGYIYAKEGWRGYNEVRFKLPLPAKELFFAPKESQPHHLLRLDSSHETIIAKKGFS